MKYLLKVTKIAFIALTLITAMSCDDDDDNIIEIDDTVVPAFTIADFVSGDDDYSSLLAALQQTGLDATLAGDGDFTVFAPNNDAFEDFLDGEDLEDVDNNDLTQILLNHVLGVSQLSTELSTGYVKTLATEESTGANIDMYVDTTDGVVLNGASTVTTADIQTDNGVIHAVDNVIPLPTVVTFATTNPDLSSLVAALVNDGDDDDDDDDDTFVNLLSDTDQDFTVFAPTNVAFATFLDGADLDDIDDTVLAQTLLNHVLVGNVAISSGLSTGYINTSATFNGEEDAPLSLYVNTDDGVVLNGGPTVVAADIVTVNGVVHVVDEVIALPDVTTFAIADPTFDTLEAALSSVEEDAGFIAALQTPYDGDDDDEDNVPFTVFAPTNEAFGLLLDDLGADSLDDIPSETVAATLALHVVPEANVRAEDLEDLDGASVNTLAEGNITIDAATPAVIDPDGGSNPIIVTNVQATNGVIHAVSRVLRDL